MRFVVDAQLPPLLADWLRSKGHQAAHVSAVLGDQASDAAIVQHASYAVIVSKDGDFMSLLEGRADPPQLLWIRCGNTRNAALLKMLATEWARIERELVDGAAVVEAG